VFLVCLWIVSGAQISRQKTKDIFCNDPDCGKLAAELVSSKGYPVEEHVVTTKDQYNIKIQRIPRGKNYIPGTASKGAVLLQHGLLDASHTWVINFPKQSLGFILADAGYDVWLGNTRGNTYGLSHSKYSVDDLRFWNFTFDDFIRDDLPSMVNHVLNKTGEKQLFYIGHSQGTMMGFGALSTNADLASKIRLFVALAPVMTLGSLEVSLLYYLAEFHMEELNWILGNKDFAASTPILENILSVACEVDQSLCDTVMCALMGCNMENWNSTRWPVYAHHDPAGTSCKNIAHFAQLVREDKFQKYDYGADGNMKQYGQKTPPQYPVPDLKVKVALFTGSQDYLADPTDVKKLISVLPKDKVVFNKNIEKYSHIDFIWGYDAPSILYKDILDLFGKY